MNAKNQYWNHNLSAPGLPPGGRAPGNAEQGLLPLDDALDPFSFDALMIHAWLSQLLDDVTGLYASRRNARSFGVQTGQAQRAFLRMFGHPNDDELRRLVQSMYRFTTCEDPLGIILFRALDALCAEHDCQGGFSGPLAPDCSEFTGRQAVRWMRESMDRWLEWVDAIVHAQTHAQWHLAPECFDADPLKREAAAQLARQRRLAQFRASMNLNWQTQHSDTTRFYREMPLWQLLPQSAISQPQRPWPHPELDEAIIALWPLVKRHHWSYGDLLRVLGDLVDCSDDCICQSERNLGIYCFNTLRLRKPGQGRTARHERPAGYVVALRLFPPATKVAPGGLAFETAQPFHASRWEETIQASV